MIDRYINQPMVQWPPDEPPPCEHDWTGLSSGMGIKKYLILDGFSEMAELEIDRLQRHGSSTT